MFMVTLTLYFKVLVEFGITKSEQFFVTITVF